MFMFAFVITEVLTTMICINICDIKCFSNVLLLFQIGMQYVKYILSIGKVFILREYNWGAAVVEWLSSWLAEQEDRGSIPGLAT